MHLSRMPLLGAAALLAAAAAVWGGVALASAPTHTGSKPGAKQSGPARALPVRSNKVAKCKALACVHFDDNGTTMIGEHPNVASVSHPSTGRYCVTLVSKLQVNDDTPPVITVDYPNSPSDLFFPMWDTNSTCAGNSVAIRVFNDGTALADAALFVAIP